MYKLESIRNAHKELMIKYETLEDKSEILRSQELNQLLAEIKSQSKETIAQYGKEVNQLKQEFAAMVKQWQAQSSYVEKSAIDVTAPFDINQSSVFGSLNSLNGTVHPVAAAQQEMIDLFARMGFRSIESRQLDNQYFMFDSLNFPDDHPARDHYDTFLLEEKDDKGRPLVAPSHTSIMQNRILKEFKDDLEEGEPIAFVVPGRVFRNEDLDARHEHTFHQLEGIYVGEDITTANLISTLKEWMAGYFKKDVEIKTQPFYFPFTEPSLEFAISCPFCDKAGCNICGEGWLELGGCGMIHPNVLKEAGIDPVKYSGFAWGFGTERMVMIRYGIEDVRHFMSGKLDFLGQFK